MAPIHFIARAGSRLCAERHVIIAYATSPGQIASDGAGRNGAYTAALLKHIDSPDVSLESMFKRVRNTLSAATNGNKSPGNTRRFCTLAISFSTLVSVHVSTNTLIPPSVTACSYLMNPRLRTASSRVSKRMTGIAKILLSTN